MSQLLVGTGAYGSVLKPHEKFVLGPIDMSPMKFKFDEAKSAEAGTGFKFMVSGVLQHHTRNMSYARIFIKVPNGLYFSTGRFLRGPYDMWKGQMFTNQGKYIPLDIESLDDIPQCHPGNPSDYKRTRKGWTVSIPYFDIEFPSHTGSVELYAKKFVLTLASNYTSESECGANFAAWLKITKPKLYA